MQSPVESHFAITPVTNSERSSPANGFTSLDCTDLLQQELDQLELQHVEQTEDNVKQEKTPELNLQSTFSIDGLLSPTEETISMFLRTHEEDKQSENNECIGDNENVQKAENSDTGEVG